MLATFCGRDFEDPRVVTSHSNRLYLRFRSDGSASARGFRLHYDATSTGCGGELTSATGSIISPNYPQHYADDAECFWVIRLSRGNAVRIVVEDINLEFTSGCSYDALEVRTSFSVNTAGNFVYTSCVF